MVSRHKQLRLYLTRYFEVPVIVVFTKYDQFLRNVEMHLVDYPNEHPDSSLSVSKVAEKRFQEYYLRLLPGGVRFVLLESEFQFECQDYMPMTLFGRNAQGKYVLR
jgi:hypothetical protein